MPYREILAGLVSRTADPIRLAQYQAELECPPLPIALDYLWRTYHRIRRRKAGNGFGAQPIEWPDIDAFLRLSALALAPWEIEILEDLDDVFLQDHSKAQLEID